MKWRQNIAATALAALVSGGVFAYVQRAEIFEALDTRPLPKVERIDYYSEAIDQTYVLYVQLPPGYDPEGAPCPVLYATDGEGAHGMYNELVLPLIRRREIPPIITVGIAYKDVPPVSGILGFDPSAAGLAPENGELDAGEVRIRDYTPVGTEHAVNGGGAPKFLAFITEKVVPFIDATYNTDPNDRAIAGHSLGGLFSLYAALTAPDVFNRCISTSPSLFWGKRAIFDCEEAFAKSHSEWDAHLYIGLGTDESTILGEAVFDMMELLSSRRYANLSMKQEWHKGENHMSVIFPAASSGLKFIY